VTGAAIKLLRAIRHAGLVALSPLDYVSRSFDLLLIQKN